MSTHKAVVHVPTGEFKNKSGQFECGPFEPQRPVLSVTNGVTIYDPDYDVVVVPRMPDPRTERWSGSAIVAKTATEIASDAARQVDLETDREMQGLRDNVLLAIAEELNVADPAGFVRNVRNRVIALHRKRNIQPKKGK